ncbi:MAG TPA: SMP-30/gluconolactonase/LRE family protein [Pseudolabrys sp.]|nr:SMP-30/gluconolactonase/LRE family protein [Pseudolabrys sp.]
MIDVEVAVAAHATIGESPTWHAAEAALYWIDVKKPALHRYVPASDASRTWPLTSDVGAFALCEDGSAIVALRHGMHRLDLSTGKLVLLAPPPFDPLLFRFNEGICDQTGRFWVGVMFDPLDAGPAPRKGHLHSFTLAGGLRRENDSAELHNGMAISEDGTKFFLSHSREGGIYSFDFGPAAVNLGARTEFARIATELGLPDGAALDAEGCYWCAVHGAGRLRRYTADGDVDCDIEVPVSKPTMCAFAGNDLEMMYVTSAAQGIDLAEEPLAGALLRFRPGVKGIARSCTVRAVTAAQAF